MKNKTSTLKFTPKKKPEDYPFQVKIRKDLFELTKAQMIKDKTTWRMLVEQLFEFYIKQSRE